MFATVTPHQSTENLARFSARVAAMLSALVGRARLALSANAEAHWFDLSDHLLRDIGKSPLDAEIARYNSRWGTPKRPDFLHRGRLGL